MQDIPHVLCVALGGNANVSVERPSAMTCIDAIGVALVLAYVCHQPAAKI